jgi:Fur family ferric uptake transcriptional regulator
MEKPDIKELLREHGYKATPGRVALLEVLWEEGVPLSVQSIIQKLKKAPDEATLYRALEALAGSGILRRVDLGHSHAHYEFEKEHHHHLVCIDCGLIEDVENCSIEKAQKRVAEQSKKFISIYSHNLEFFGQCKNCLKA